MHNVIILLLFLWFALHVIFPRDDPLPTKEDKSTIGSHESYSSEEEDDDESEVGIAEDTEDLPDDDCICEHCPTREQLGRRLVCCMSLDRWQAKFVSEGEFTHYDCGLSITVMIMLIFVKITMKSIPV